MAYPKYVFENQITPEGKKLVEWLDVNVAEALAPGASPDKFNAMSGPLKEYASMVRGASRLPVDKWLTTFQQSANNAWQLMSDVEAIAVKEAEEKQRIAESTDKTAKLETELAKLQAIIETKVAALEADNARLAAENASLRETAPAAVTEAVQPEAVSKKTTKKGVKAAKVAEVATETAPEVPETEETDAEEETKDAAAEGETPEGE